MAAFENRLVVQWGDCDAFGIVYYPNFLRWMDGTFHTMSEACGISHRDLPGMGIKGTPLADAGCSFRSPVSYGDPLEIRAQVARLGTSSLQMTYRFATTRERLVAEGRETRVFVRETEAGLKATPIPESVRAALSPYIA